MLGVSQLPLWARKTFHTTISDGDCDYNHDKHPSYYHKRPPYSLSYSQTLINYLPPQHQDSHTHTRQHPSFSFISLLLNHSLYAPLHNYNHLKIILWRAHKTKQNSLVHARTHKHERLGVHWNTKNFESKCWVQLFAAAPKDALF